MYVHVNSLNSHESTAKSTVRFRNFTRIGSIRTVLRLRLQINSVKRKLGKVSTKAFLENFHPGNQQDSRHCSSSSKRKCLQKAAFNFQRVLCTSKMAGISLIFLDGRGVRRVVPATSGEGKQEGYGTRDREVLTLYPTPTLPFLLIRPMWRLEKTFCFFLKSMTFTWKKGNLYFFFFNF